MPFEGRYQKNVAMNVAAKREANQAAVQERKAQRAALGPRPIPVGMSPGDFTRPVAKPAKPGTEPTESYPEKPQGGGTSQYMGLRRNPRTLDY